MSSVVRLSRFPIVLFIIATVVNLLGAAIRPGLTGTDYLGRLSAEPDRMAAGALLITEAGGLVGDLTGESDYMNTGNIVGGNPKVFVQLLQIIAPHLDAKLKA